MHLPGDRGRDRNKVHSLHVDPNGFQVELPERHGETVLTIVGSGTVRLATLEASTIPVLAESAPMRLGPSIVYPTKEGMTVFEPDSPGTQVRPLSIKSPQDYNDSSAPSVTVLSNAEACGLTTAGLVNCTGHGFIAGDEVKFAESVGGVTAGTAYYVVTAGWSADAFKFSATKTVNNDGAPFTITAEAATMVCSAYRQLFDFAAGGHYFTAVNGVAGLLADSGSGTWVDYQSITLMEGSPKSTPKCFTLDLGSAGVDLTGKTYLLLDLSLEWVGSKPSSQQMGNGRMLGAGIFSGRDNVPSNIRIMTAEQVKDWQAAWENWNQARVSGVSGLSLSLYGDQECSNLIRTYELPALHEAGKITRMCVHLGGAAGTVKSVAIGTTDSYLAPPPGASWRVWLHTMPFTEDWKFAGNTLLPEPRYQDSPWVWLLPPDPGSSNVTSATVLETFTAGAWTDFAPGRPNVKYCWCNAAKNLLGEAVYEYMVSNPSAESGEVFPDPWGALRVVMDEPADSDGNTFSSEYGDYATNFLLYRALQDGWSGSWFDFVYLGTERITPSTPANYAVVTDQGDTADPLLGTVEIPGTLELDNDYASPARYVALSQGRVWAACLDWNETVGKWDRPTAIEVSSEGKPGPSRRRWTTRRRSRTGANWTATRRRGRKCGGCWRGMRTCWCSWITNCSRCEATRRWGRVISSRGWTASGACRGERLPIAGRW